MGDIADETWYDFGALGGCGCYNCGNWRCKDKNCLEPGETDCEAWQHPDTEELHEGF